MPRVEYNDNEFWIALLTVAFRGSFMEVVGYAGTENRGL